MSTITGNDMKHDAPFDVAASPRLLDGHHRTDFECGVAGFGFGSIEADESFFQLN
jgi:hypothetical protein